MAAPEATEAVPSLASLLRSTAESLAARSSMTAAAGQSGPGPAAGKKGPAASPAFTLTSTPDALLAHPAAPPYLAALLAQPLAHIEALPGSLAAQSTALDQDLSSLAYARYSAFLQSHAAAQSISALFATLSDSLAALLDSTAALERAATSFGTKVHAVRDKRDRMARVRDRIAEVEELLDAPSVVDACVRAGYWSEAIDVATRLENLHKRLLANASPSSLGSTPAPVPASGAGKDADADADADAEGDGDGDGEDVEASEEGRGARVLLDRIRSEVNVALLSLRTRVLETLTHRTLKLPGAVRAIGVLRRIADRGLVPSTGGDRRRRRPAHPSELDEDALRVVFLVARWKCLRGELGAVEAQMTAAGIHLGRPDRESGGRGGASSKPDELLHVSVEENDERARWTKRWIEVWREIVGETITMYAEVFLGRAPEQVKGNYGGGGGGLQAHALTPTAPLHLFLSTALDSLSAVLARAVAGLNSSAALSSLVTQLTYCSHSFARYGFDFRQVIQLRERIELRIGRIVALEWEAAGRAWEKEWRDAWGHSGGAVMTAAKARRSGRVPLTDWLVVPEGLSTALATPVPPPPSQGYDPPAGATWHHQPSPSIALFPPLARFLNAHATALNSLRLLPPVSLYTPLRRAQAVELDRATQVLSAFADAWLAAIASTPLLSSPNAGFTSPTLHLGPTDQNHDHRDGNDDGLSVDERTIAHERDEERRAVAAAVAWFGRAVVPWCAEALETGVYAELVESGRAGDRRLADGVRHARRRCEQLVAKIEGREYVEPNSSVPVAAATAAAPAAVGTGADAPVDGGGGGALVSNGEDAAMASDKAPVLKSPPPIATTQLPVIDPEAPVSAAPSSLATSPNRDPLDPTSAALNGHASKPAEFVASPTDAAVSEPDPDPDLLDVGTVIPGGGEITAAAAAATSATIAAADSAAAGGETDAPYVVNEKAPPPPVPAEPAAVLEPDVVPGSQ